MNHNQIDLTSSILQSYKDKYERLSIRLRESNLLNSARSYNQSSNKKENINSPAYDVVDYKKQYF